MIYASDPASAPDSEFVPGDVRWLVPGNAGRLLDARRTPVTVVGVVAERGAFVVEVGAFEDAGARWELALGEVESFQFARGAEQRDDANALRAAFAALDAPLEVEADGAVRGATLRRIADTLAGAPPVAARDVAARVAAREGDPRLYAALDAFLAERDLLDLERELVAVLVSNPRSGEHVKGHAIVAAELGLAPFAGRAPRDPALFDGRWSKERRAEHLVARLAFTRAVLADAPVTLYRGAATESAIDPLPRGTFVSATFSREVATEHFEGSPATRAALLVRQEVPADRVLMTFLETRGMNERFREAEALLVGGSDAWAGRPLASR